MDPSIIEAHIIIRQMLNTPPDYVRKYTPKVQFRAFERELVNTEYELLNFISPSLRRYNL